MVAQFLFYQHPSIHTLDDIYCSRPVVALHTEISGTLFGALLLCCVGKIHCTVHRDCLKNVLFMSEIIETIESQRGNSFSYER